MHRIESDNVAQDSQGRNIFKDGPPGTTINAAWLTAVQEEIASVIEGYGISLGTKLNDNHVQLWQVISSVLNKLGRTATYIFASNDSEAKSQMGADQIISTSADAAAIIKAKAAELSALGGGTIMCLEGTYNCISELDWSSYVDLIGCGYRTVFKRKAAITNVIDNSAGEYCKFENFRIDGNKAAFPGVIKNGLKGKQLDRSSSYKNIISHDTDGIGFLYCIIMFGCIAYNNTTDGFNNCHQLSGCYSYSNMQYGYNGCEDLNNCASYTNTNHGFYSCRRLLSCYAQSNSESGFRYCFYLNSCYARLNTDSGFYDCLGINNCTSYQNSKSGFQLCGKLVSCYSTTNAASAWPFTSCLPMQQCYTTTGGGSAWRSCFADHGGTQATADTAAGGYNLA